VNINVYLPDELGQRAKEAQLEFSALLRHAVTEELERRAELEAARDGMVSQEIEAYDRDRNPLLLRFTGKPIGGDVGVQGYLTDEGTVIIVFEEDYTTFDNVDEFSAWVVDPTRNALDRHSEQSLDEIVAELGGRRVVNIK
jgi:hypothetical protein